MKQEKILNYINALEEEALRQAGITPARIANELGAQAFGELDPENEWVKLAGLVPWDTVEKEYAKQFATRRLQERR